MWVTNSKPIPNLRSLLPCPPLIAVGQIGVPFKSDPLPSLVLGQGWNWERLVAPREMFKIPLLIWLIYILFTCSATSQKFWKSTILHERFFFLICDPRKKFFFNTSPKKKKSYYVRSWVIGSWGLGFNFLSLIYLDRVCLCGLWCAQED